MLTPLLLLAWTTSAAMAMSLGPELIGVEEERLSLKINGGSLCYNTLGSECRTGRDTCRVTGRCLSQNIGQVCCCDFCSSNTRSRNFPACGDDGVTYNSYCEYRRQQCVRNIQITLTYKGQCKEACAQKKRMILKQQNTGILRHGYVPDCDENNPNLYKTRQCNITDWVCWCVVPHSNKIITEPRSIEHRDDLNCDLELKIHVLRESCEPCEIVREILRSYRGISDYDYSNRRQDPEERSDLIKANELFGMFDNPRKDGYLSSSEQDLIARWLNITKFCVLETLGICDDDEDGRLSRAEWSQCLVHRYSSSRERHSTC